MLEINQLCAERGEHHFCYDLTCHSGQIVALLGRSGCGKSTLLAMIAGFLPAKGQLDWQGQSLLEQSVAQRPVSSLFQQHNLFEHLSVAQNLALGIKGSLRLNLQERQALEQVAQQLDIHALLAQKPPQLSGGQRQRAALARAILRHRPILLLDEPFSALDPQLCDECLQLVRQLAQQHQLTVLLVTHQLSDAYAIADSIAFIEQGRVVVQCPVDELVTQSNVSVQQYLSVSPATSRPQY